MILTCPACETQYFAADQTVAAAGRKVRCAACGHQWTLERPANTAPSGPQAHEVYLSRKRARARRARGWARLLAWSLSFALLAGAGVGLVVMREEVVRIWPQSASTYARLGLPVNRFGLEIERLDFVRTFEGTTPILSVRGEAVNPGTRARPSPDVRLTLRDETGASVGEHLVSLPQPEVPAGQAVVFATVITNPPVDTYTIDVAFVPLTVPATTETAQAPAGGTP